MPVERNSARISIKGLAKFMTSSNLTQRKTLRDFKYPDPEGSAQAIYYREARDFVRAFHERSLPLEWLRQRASLLSSLAGQSSKNAETRLRNNARAINAYRENFPNTRYSILPDLRLEFTNAAVRVTAYPDLHVREGGVEKLLRFEFGSAELNERAIQILAQGMLMAAAASAVDITPRGVIVVDVPRGRVYEAGRLRSRLTREIEAACQTIADIWPRL
jgi:hypothetical protein